MVVAALALSVSAKSTGNDVAKIIAHKNSEILFITFFITGTPISQFTILFSYIHLNNSVRTFVIIQFLCYMRKGPQMWSFPWKKENRELINSQEMENKIYIEIGVTL